MHLPIPHHAAGTDTSRSTVPCCSLTVPDRQAVSPPARSLHCTWSDSRFSPDRIFSIPAAGTAAVLHVSLPHTADAVLHFCRRFHLPGTKLQTAQFWHGHRSFTQNPASPLSENRALFSPSLYFIAFSRLPRNTKGYSSPLEPCMVFTATASSAPAETDDC